MADLALSVPRGSFGWFDRGCRVERSARTPGPQDRVFVPSTSMVTKKKGAEVAPLEYCGLMSFSSVEADRLEAVSALP